MKLSMHSKKIKVGQIIACTKKKMKFAGCLRAHITGCLIYKRFHNIYRKEQKIDIPIKYSGFTVKYSIRASKTQRSPT